MIFGKFFLISFITGITRLSSSSTDIGSELGLVDSPPTSIISAPSEISVSACLTALSKEKYLPPS